MAAWVGLGINYGHQFPHNPYDVQQVAADLDFLQSAGITRLRIAFPVWHDTNGTIASCQWLVQYALSRGFYVVWGVVLQSPANASQWTQFKQYIMQTLVPWAQGLQSSRLELALGNEEEFHCDGTSLTIATLVYDIGNMAYAAKAAYTYGPISYQASIAHISDWTAAGLGGLDRIGFNCYTRSAAGVPFQANIIKTAFPNKAYIAEWGTGSGYNDYGNEQAWRDVIYGQRLAWQASGLPEAYYFSYRDGSFGLPSNAWAAKTTSGNFRLMAPWLFGMRPWFTGNPNSALARQASSSRTVAPTRPTGPTRSIV